MLPEPHSHYGVLHIQTAPPAAKLAAMPVYRSALLRFADEGRALYDEDGLLAVGPDAQILQMNWLVEGVVGKVSR